MVPTSPDNRGSTVRAETFLPFVGWAFQSLSHGFPVEFRLLMGRILKWAKQVEKK